MQNPEPWEKTGRFDDQEVEVTELEDDDDGGEVIEHIEMVQLGMINELEDEADMLNQHILRTYLVDIFHYKLNK